MFKTCSLGHEEIVYECRECPLCTALAGNELKQMIKQEKKELYTKLYINMQEIVNNYKDDTGREVIREETGTLMHWLYRQSEK